MRESILRRHVVQLLHKFSAFAVENPAWPGTPDVSSTAGWIELKVLKRWPKRVGPVRVPHLTPIQRIWHRKWAEAGGKSWLLLMIENDVLLIDGKLMDKVGFVEKAELLSIAWKHWPSKNAMSAELEMFIRPGIGARGVRN